MNATYLTPEGYKKLEEELEYLRTVKRQEVAQRLHEALAEGGELIENAEYEAAKNEQAFVEGRIQELEYLLSNARVVDHLPSDEVGIGSRVTVAYDDGSEETYTVVGAAEASPREGLISNESPLGKALMGHKAGETVAVQAPDGTFTVKILKVV